MRCRGFKFWKFFGALSVSLVVSESSGFAETNAPLKYTVSWLGNTFSGAGNRWVQNFFIHTHVQPDGTINTWSHWDEGGKKFGQYRDGDVVGNTNTHPNSLETVDQAKRHW